MRVMLILAVWLTFAFDAAGQEFRDPDLGQGIAEGFATRESLWLRGTNGVVVRLDRVSGDRKLVAKDVIDLITDNGRLWALGQRGQTNLYYVVDLFDADGAAAVGPAERQGDRYFDPGEDAEGQVLGLITWPGQERPAIVTQRGLLPLSEGAHRQKFAASLQAYGHLAAPDGRSLYSGYNRGEWGGGLRHVDLDTGAVSFVTEEGANLCEGTLNPACDPIVGLFPDRESPGCVIVGSGISHIGVSKGDVYRVCGSTITPIFSTPKPTVGDRWMLRAQPWPLDGLFEVSNGWIGTSRDRYFRSDRGRVEERPMPTFRNWSGVRISDEQDGVLFVVSACCWGSADDPTLYRAIAIPVAGNDDAH